MPSPNQIKVQSGDNLLLVGTMKGAFLFRGDTKREHWEERAHTFRGVAFTRWRLMDATAGRNFGQR